MARLLGLLLASLAPAGCFMTTCIGDEVRDTFTSVDATAFAWHAPASLAHSADVSGTLSNRSAARDCTAALYRFTREPTATDIPALVVGEPAPELADAELLAQVDLPRATAAHRFVASIDPLVLGEDVTGQPPRDEWLVVALCTDADVDLALIFDKVLCREGTRESESAGRGVVRLW